MTDRQKNITLNFPKKFLWGAATAAHQVEGGNHNQWSVWEFENARTLAVQAEHNVSYVPVWDEIKAEATKPDNYISGQASDHFRQYEKDFDILKKMNMNAFRFSIEWSRIEPKEGAWSAEGITHYKRYIQALKDRGIEPVMTLFHFTLPVWFTEKGGFEKQGNIKYFLRFAEKVLREIGTHVRYIVTINEPEVYATMSYGEGVWPPNKTSKMAKIKVLRNLVTAHNKTAKLAHKVSRRYKVGVAYNVAFHYAGDDALLSQTTTKVKQWARDDFFLNAVRRSTDWIGVNYYFSERYYGYRSHNPNNQVSDLGWDMQPENIQFVLERLFAKYGKPLMVTENGVADRNDEYRQWWLSKTLQAMHKALKNGVPLEGYLHWSLLDNFEWAYGKWPRFGLIEVDYETGKRRPRKSAAWFARVLKHIRQ
jgi:beta-glucosidase